jgi:small subunit ribosomal protein S20
VANHQSAIKRARQNLKRNLRNKSRKTAVKSVTKRLEAAVNENKTEEAVLEFKKAQKMIAKTASKGVFHKKTAARKISRLARLVNKASVS